MAKAIEFRPCASNVMMILLCFALPENSTLEWVYFFESSCWFFAPQCCSQRGIKGGAHIWHCRFDQEEGKEGELLRSCMLVERSGKYEA